MENFIPDSRFWYLDVRSGRIVIDNPPEMIGITEPPATLKEFIDFKNKILSYDIRTRIIFNNDDLGITESGCWPLKYIKVAHIEDKFYLFNRYWRYLNWRKLLTDEKP